MHRFAKDNSLNTLLLAMGLVLFAGFFLGGCRSYPACKTDQHCEDYDQGTPYCVDQICRACAQDTHCGEGQQCSNNQCVRIPGWCADDSMCRAPERCRDNRCGPQCLGEDDCEDGQICESGRCVTAPECRADGDCAEGQVCRGGSCVDPPAPADPCARGLRTINFDFDESVLTRAAISDLEFNAQCIRDRATPSSIAIEGHCDERGTHEYNMRLGERRAQSVRNWLVNNGVDRSSLRTVSYGFTRPVDSRSNESAWSRNRRAEFVLE